MKLIKVLHYVPNFSVNTETFIYDQILGIQSHGLESAVLTTKRLNLESRPFSNVYISPFKNIWNERITQSLALRFQLMPYLIDYKYWGKVLQEFRPDVVHCHTGNAVKGWMHVSEKLGVTIPTVASMHGSDVNSEPLIRNKYKDVLASAGHKEFVYWTVPSNFLKQKMTMNLSVSQDKISIVHNAINPVFTKSCKRISFNQLKVISVGRFIPCKGHIFLIRAFARTLEVYPNAILTLVGNGPLKKSLIEHAQELGIYSNIRFIDYISHDDLPNLLSEHNIYVQPSIRDEITQQEESFGVAALEAMAVGLSVIVTQCGGLKELASFCDKKSVSVVQQKNKDDIADAINKHFMEKTPVSFEDRIKISDIFSSRKNITSILEIYRHAVNKV
ncbi:hypothetical protein B0W48_06070 [Pseudoalteromonas aliena]|uniref:Glycosyl transferase family 1 n=1 Tax=Pseudoalteromonas aliena TaxID=247523 RepID=A0A1Q2GWD5_9GAMM|nr:glycosyltransferase family 4 protein [Pseudoalteromonas aliena]AQP99406.1 hypothetical protein B0W48_06070 [Pseudoalteromonas aliena]